jgi:hypothetical protein
MYTGPNLTNDDLVFGYDTGYGVANTAAPTRFYQGKPTANMLTSGDNFGNWNKTQNSGNPPTITSGVAPGPFVGTLADRMSIPTGGSYPRIWQNYTPASTATHTFSVWLKAESSGQGVFVGAFRNSPWSLPSSTSFTITDEWVNYSFAINPQDTTSMQLYIGSHDSHKGKEFLIYGAQLQTGSDKSPFVDGTRSSTNSLIDLTKSTDLTLSAISFDSTGQPTFDGTDDEINLDSQASVFPVGGNITIESVVKWDDLTPNGVIVSYGGNQTNSGLLFQNEFSAGLELSMFDGNGNSGRAKILTANSTQYLDKYIHMVGTYDGSTILLYINGSQVATASYTHGYPSQSYFRIGNEYNRSYFANIDLNVLKIYQRTLTANEIKSNFNAYKNRFNI